MEIKVHVSDSKDIPHNNMTGIQIGSYSPLIEFRDTFRSRETIPPLLITFSVRSLSQSNTIIRFGLV